MSEENQHDELAERFLNRDGHLGELMANRWLAGELDGEEKAFVAGHLDECARCRTRLEAVEKFDAGFSIRPSATVVAAAAKAGDPEAAEVVSLGEAREKRSERRAFVVLAIAAAAAVAVTVLVTRQPEAPRPAEVEEDGIRFKGGGLALEIFGHDGEKTRPLHNDDVVHPGDRLGFRVTSREGGFFLVAGVDDTGQVYPVHPQSGAAVHLGPQADKKELDSAVRLDDVGKKERIVAILCPKPYTLQEIGDRVRGAKTLGAKPSEDRFENCVYHETTLRKEPR